MAYDEILNGEIVAGQPVKQSLMFRFRDNPIAIAAGDAGAPRVAIDLAGQTAIGTDELDPTAQLAPDGMGGVIWRRASTLIDDFVAGSDKVFAQVITGTTEPMQIAEAAVADSLGAVRVTFPNTSGVRSLLLRTNPLHSLGARAWEIAMRVRRNTAWNDSDGTMGLGALPNADMEPNGVYFHTRPGFMSGNWRARSPNASIQEDLGVGPSLDWQELRLRRVDATATSDYEFYIDGVLVHTIDGLTAGLPSMVSSHFLGLNARKGGSAGNMQIDIDWLRVIFP